MPSTSRNKGSTGLLPAPDDGAYREYIFAFTAKCPGFQKGSPCKEEQFGAKALSDNAGFLPPTSLSNLAGVLQQTIPPMADGEEDAYLMINYEAPEIQAEVIKASLPKRRVFIFCSPCIPAITTAISICDQNTTMVVKYQVRIDPRIPCSCYTSVDDALSRIESIAHTIHDVDSGRHWAALDGKSAAWIEHVDRAWLEQVLYLDDKEIDPIQTTRPNPKADAAFRALFKRPPQNRLYHNNFAVLLAETESNGWLVAEATHSNPTPRIRAPLDGDIFHFLRQTAPAKWMRHFIGVFTIRDAPKRRRNDSPPPPVPQPAGRSLKRKADGVNEMEVQE